MEEREGWPAAMAAWEDWKGGGYSTYDATIIESLCLSLDEKPVVVDGQPLKTCSVIENAIMVAINNRAKFRTAKGAMAYVRKVLELARDDGRWPYQRPTAKSYRKHPRTTKDELRKLGRGDTPDQRRHPPKF